MHRTIHISLTPNSSDEVCRKLLVLETVISLSLSRGASLKPAGDVIMVDALNRGTDEILKLVETAANGQPFSITTSESASLIDPSQAKTIRKDVDEANWEEIIIGLRHQARITTNFIWLMIAGGAISAVGLVSEPVPMMMAFAAAGIIAPGFEPIVAVPLGLIFKRGGIVWRGCLSLLAGYATLVLSAALVIWILLAAGSIGKNELLSNSDIESIINPTLKEMIVSGCGAAAGIIITASYRRSVIAGALIALILIPAAAIVGAGIAIGDAKLIFGGLMRLGIDILFVVGFGLFIFGFKQFFVHRRKPLI